MTVRADTHRHKILFVTWDGPQTTYLEGLYLPIFQRLGGLGVGFHVLQFTWGDARIIDVRRRACERAGISYRAVRVWRWPSAALGSALTVLRGVPHLRRAVREHQVQAVMPRSVLPALTTLIAVGPKGPPIIFDADGLALDERVDFAGQSPTGLVYRILRDVESQAVRRARIVLTRTQRAAEILLARAGAGTDPGKLHVVGNGRDPDRFAPGDRVRRESVRRQLGLSESAPLLVYAGSLGPQYGVASMLRLLELVRDRRSDAHLLMLTPSLDLLRDALLARLGIASAVTARSVAPQDVPAYLASADLGLALRDPSFSMQAVAPIKIGEYLLCGLPIVVSSRAGGLSARLSSEVAYLLDDHSAESGLAAAADWFVERVLPAADASRERCRSIGLAEFSLDVTVARYTGALRSVIGP